MCRDRGIKFWIRLPRAGQRIKVAETRPFVGQAESFVEGKNCRLIQIQAGLFEFQSPSAINSSRYLT